MTEPRKRLVFFDMAIPFFLPMWRRVLAVAVPVLWAMFEFAAGEAIWGVIFAGLGGLAGWKFWQADWAAVADAAAKSHQGR